MKRIEDQNYKSPKELIHYLVKAAGKNANLLMNIGPQPNGELPATAVEHLKQVGKWMNQYGETIYGTRGGDCIPINAVIHSLTGINNLSAFLPIPAAIVLILVSVALTLLSGLIPSRSAAKKDPVVALRTE